MEQHYEQFFAIQKQLYKQGIPDDLIPIFFRHLGSLNETYDDMINKRCFWLIEYDQPYFDLTSHVLLKTKRERMGHYCNVCNKILLVFNHNQLRRHIKSAEHRKSLEDVKPTYNEGINHKRFEHAFLTTDNKYNKWSRCKKKKIIQTMKFKQKKLNLKNEFII